MRAETKTKVEDVLSFLKGKSDGNYVLGTINEVAKTKGLTTQSIVQAIRNSGVVSIQKATDVGLDIRSTQGKLQNPSAVAYRWEGPSVITPDFVSKFIDKLETSTKKSKVSKVKKLVHKQHAEKTFTFTSEQISFFSNLSFEGSVIPVSLGEKLTVYNVKSLKCVKQDIGNKIILLDSNDKSVVQMKSASDFTLTIKTVNGKPTEINIRFI